jgi:FKBP-type peptidyl-prolyl cis-trans isomerase FklB
MKPSLRISLNIVLAASLMLGLVACQKSEPTPVMSEESSATPEPTASTPAPAANEVSLETLDQKVSYGIGRNIGNDITRDENIDVDGEALIAGLRDSINGAESRMTEEEIRTAFGEIRNRAQAAQAAVIAQEQQRALDFLTANGARPEVTTTESGLQYEILTAGTGPVPTTADRVKVHYHGTLVDGTVFDSSVQRGEPIEFPVTGVIRGWVEALQLMPAGSKWKLAIPPDLGYGDNGSGAIPGGAALIFEVELLEVISPETPAAG